MEYRLKIGIIVAIAFVAGIVGTLSFASYETQTEYVLPQSNPADENIGLGAYVIVEAYHEDGTLFHTFEGQNNLTALTLNAISSCATGIDSTPSNFGSCDSWIDSLRLQGRNQTDDNTIISPSPRINAVPLLLPITCETDNPTNGCTGWELTGTFDFDTLSCTPDVDCFFVDRIESGQALGSPGLMWQFNFINVDPTIPIGPNDRLFVNMTFNVSP